MREFKLSVIVAAHGRPQLLMRALSSLKALGNTVQIVLCADEGSLATRQVAVQQLREDDIFISLPGVRGPAATRNAGLQFATGEWITFLDDDDTFDSSLGAELFDALSGDIIYYTNFRKIFERREKDGTVTQVRSKIKNTNRKSLSELEVRNFITVNAFFAPRSIASGLQFNTDLTTSEDWEFLLKLKERFEFRHRDICCSNWHIEEGTDQSRNAAGRKERAVNYLKIYEAHPASSADIQSGRSNMLRKLGAKVPEAQIADLATIGTSD